MSLTNMLSRLEVHASLARLFGRADPVASLVTGDEVGRLGDVAISGLGASNDRFAPANDEFRPHIVARRDERRAKREIRSA